ncbi:MAG TPA: flavin reductase family protein [Candidatus Dormibacteraeota bacterium]|nr:flavin reductase family protein [Candidatus Dormibacteraeota bacterium]
MPSPGSAQPHAGGIDQEAYRRILGHFLSGVAIVTGMGDSGPAGLAVNSFTAVSLEPPLVAFFPAAQSTSWPRIRSAGRFCVNILGHEQEDVCRRFAMSGVDKFAGLGWSAAPSGAPLLDGCLAWIDCTLDSEHPAGDHTVVLGRVIAFEARDDAEHPLAFYRGGYGGFRPGG